MKLAVAALLAGLMVTAAIMGVVTSVQREHSPTAAAARDQVAAELERCRAATQPNEDCERAWAERRRRFFGEEGKGR